MKENILVVHGGAPTAVMNASLYGVIREAEKYPNIDHIYAAIGGSGGILKEHFLDLKTIEKDKIESLPYTPASAIGTSRDALEKEDYEHAFRMGISAGSASAFSELLATEAEIRQVYASIEA